MSAPDQRDMEDGSTAEPDSGLGATADPMAFGAALAGLGKRLAIQPTLVAGSMAKLAAGLAEAGAVVVTRSLGSSTDGPVSTAEPDARFSDPTWESSPG